MHPRRTVLFLGFALVALNALGDDDLIKTRDARIQGKVKAVSPTEVTIEQGGATQKVPANQVQWIAFEEEKGLTFVRRLREAVIAGHYEEALRAANVKPKKKIDRAEVQQEVDFYVALCTAKLALEGKAAIPEAGQRMRQFLVTYPESYHFFAANELVGDLLAALGQFARARDYYERAGKAPWPETKLRAALAVGRALLAENKPDEALKYFQNILDAGKGTTTDQTSTAALGKARCLAESGKHAEAIRMTEAIIAQADADNADLLGNAYLTLGIALEKAGRLPEAQFALLHVDTLYSASREVHAESLYHLAAVWTTLKKPQRALEARRTLADQYGDTRWARPSQAK